MNSKKPSYFLAKIKIKLNAEAEKINDKNVQQLKDKKALNVVMHNIP